MGRNAQVFNMFLVPAMQTTTNPYATREVSSDSVGGVAQNEIQVINNKFTVNNKYNTTHTYTHVLAINVIGHALATCYLLWRMQGHFHNFPNILDVQESKVNMITLLTNRFPGCLQRRARAGVHTCAQGLPSSDGPCVRVCLCTIRLQRKRIENDVIGFIYR